MYEDTKYTQEVPKYLKKKQKNKLYINKRHVHDFLPIKLKNDTLRYGLLTSRCSICGKKKFEFSMHQVDNDILNKNLEYFYKKDKEFKKVEKERRK